MQANGVRGGSALLWLLLLLTGCAGQTPSPGPFPGQGVAPATQLTHVPFHAQDAFQCGPASLAMMLNSQGVKATPDLLRETVYLPGREGSLQVEMVATARSQGMLVYPLEPNLTAIIAEVAAGNPVLVMQNLRFNWWPQWHFAVVVGYDLAARELYLHSGLHERRRTAFRTFDNTWARGDRWARVILPPGHIPATGTPLAYVRAAHDLEQTGKAEAASKAYIAATEAWPGDLSARFARANLALSSGNAAEAVVQFNRLLAFHGDFAAGWNNLALSLAENGCGEIARSAQACAQRLAPDDPRFRSGPEHDRQTDSGPSVRHDSESAAYCAIPACPTR